MKRGQSTVEFVILVGFLFLIFLVFGALLQSRLGQVTNVNAQLIMQQVADLVIVEASLAETTGDGYSRVFELPATLQGLAYNVSILDKQDLVLAFQGQEFVYFMNQQVFGGVGKGKNSITNRGGLINLTFLG